MEKLKELISRAILVAAWRDGDVYTEDGTYATTDVGEMIHLESSIQELFNGMESYDLICTKRVSEHMDEAIEKSIKTNHDAMIEHIAELEDFVRMVASGESADNQLKLAMSFAWIDKAKRLIEQSK